MKLLSLLALPALLLAGCDPVPSEDTGKSTDDLDADGFTVAEGDCDDYDALVNPDENEIWYDSVDQDCDGNDDDQDGDGVAVADDCDDVDDSVSEGRTAYADADGDGYGDPAVPANVCGDAVDGYVDNAEDCDDVHADAFPGAPEVCDDWDNDCDGAINEDAPEMVSYYRDADGDGFGLADDTTLSCATPAGYAAAAGDCDDLRADVHPEALELCDDVDLDCDGDATAGAVDASAWYLDGDADGAGDPATEAFACTQPEGATAEAGDCDDADATAFPGNNEVCDGVDNDCSGAPDEGLTTTFHVDADADGFGDPAATADLCALEDGYSADASDCDDGDPLVYPDAAELCDTEDNDCDGTVDEGATDARTYYADADLDGFGDPAGATVDACGAPSGYSDLATDCDDADATISPDAAETCNTLDDDCDGATDEDDAVDASTWFADDDGDGYTDAADSLVACDQPAGYLPAAADDCDDADPAVNPAGTEVCGGADEDCDGTVDESDAADAPTWYADADLDGYGTASSWSVACEQPNGSSATADDCDDAVAATSPGATESCDGVDNDCDSAVDESGATGETAWYVDADGDGYGTDVTALACDLPAGHAAATGDCDDADGAVSPAATETDDGADEDCDGYVDEDFVVSGDLVISEVTRQPRFGGGATVSDGQWFEVYNASARTVDLSNWYVQRTSGVGTDGFYVDPDDAVTVAPGDYLVLCKTDNYTSSASAYSTLACDYVWGDETQASGYAGTHHDNTFNLQRDEDTISLFVEGNASTGVEVDSVHWIYDASAPVWPRTAQYSMELGDAALDGTSNDSGSSWCLPATTSYWWRASSTNIEYGTPGAANGPC